MIRRTSHYLLLALLFTLASGHHHHCQSQADLAQIQNDFAMKYLEPEPHIALTKYYLARGDRRAAFFVLEEARRSILEEAVFDRAFQVAFEGFDNSKEGEAKVIAALRDNPNSADLQFKLADIYISRSEYDKAIQIINPALKAYP